MPMSANCGNPAITSPTGRVLESSLRARHFFSGAPTLPRAKGGAPSGIEVTARDGAGVVSFRRTLPRARARNGEWMRHPPLIELVEQFSAWDHVPQTFLERNEWT